MINTLKCQQRPSWLKCGKKVWRSHWGAYSAPLIPYLVGGVRCPSLTRALRFAGLGPRPIVAHVHAPVNARLDPSLVLIVIVVLRPARLVLGWVTASKCVRVCPRKFANTIFHKLLGEFHQLCNFGAFVEKTVWKQRDERKRDGKGKGTRIHTGTSFPHWTEISRSKVQRSQSREAKCDQTGIDWFPWILSGFLIYGQFVCIPVLFVIFVFVSWLLYVLLPRLSMCVLCYIDGHFLVEIQVVLILFGWLFLLLFTLCCRRGCKPNTAEKFAVQPKNHCK